VEVQVGQEVQPPGVSTTLDEAEQVEPKCLLKRSMVVVSFPRGTCLSVNLHPYVERWTDAALRRLLRCRVLGLHSRELKMRTPFPDRSATVVLTLDRPPRHSFGYHLGNA
jgi:hypothetical protein